ncbi:hypothetical protein BC835DRAFT_1321823 [Cytidiella melzeri]|nr:hypothetical protein BC835DRAFT_1321823 [Cytidiella melzeri]
MKVVFVVVRSRSWRWNWPVLLWCAEPEEGTAVTEEGRGDRWVQGTDPLDLRGAHPARHGASFVRPRRLGCSTPCSTSSSAGPWTTQSVAGQVLQHAKCSHPSSSLTASEMSWALRVCRRVEQLRLCRQPRVGSCPRTTTLTTLKSPQESPIGHCSKAIDILMIKASSYPYCHSL